MDRETLVAAYAQLWAVMSQMIASGKEYVRLKQEAEFMLGSILEALIQSDMNAEDIDACMKEACVQAGLSEDDQVVRIVRRELGEIERERRTAALRDNASMN